MSIATRVASDSLQNTDPDVWSLIQADRERHTRTLNFIASENTGTIDNVQLYRWDHNFSEKATLMVRLMGNMMADHKVVFSFFALLPLVVPLPFMLLGLLVCLIQALVFCTLTMVYISMAIEHEEH